MRDPRRLAVLSVLIVLACSSPTNNGNPVVELVLAILEGNAQVALGNSALPTAPAVTVTEDGEPKAGVAVTFAVVGGGGTLTGASQVTGADGVARVGSWQLGDPGAQQMTASVSGATGSPVTFTATGIVGSPASVAILAGDDQMADVGTAVAVDPMVRVSDQAGNPVGGAALTWEVVAGGGVVAGADATTAADGSGSVGSWTFGTTPGAQALLVSAGTAQSQFDGTATAGPVATIVRLEGEGQSAEAGSAVAVAPRVRLEDGFGNPTADRAVTFTPEAASGSVTGGSQMSAADGSAAVGSWTLDATPGTNTLAVASGTATTLFTATGTMAFDPTGFAGTYTGTWENTTFASVGTGSAVVAIDDGTKMATVTVVVTGFVLGTAGPVTPAPQGGSYTTAGASYAANIPPMGDITATIAPDGTITASGANVPGGGIAGWTATGTLTDSALNMAFTVNFTVGPPAVGTITMTK